MTVTEVLGGLGSWSVSLTEKTPAEVLSRLAFYGHVAIVDGRVPVAEVGDGLLTGARYVGVKRGQTDDEGRELDGEGMAYWLGDEDGKGDVIETALNLTGKTFVQCVTAIVAVDRHVRLGSVEALAGTYAGAPHQYQSPRQVLQLVCDAFGAEFRVNGNATVDAGSAAFLYNTEAPSTILVRKGAGADLDLTALPGDFGIVRSVRDYSTRVKLLGQTFTGEGATEVFVTATAGTNSPDYVDLFGTPVQSTRLISESGTPEGAAATRAQLKLNEFRRLRQALTLDTGDFEVSDSLRVGDNVLVFDPETGLVDPTREVFFAGQLWHPTVIRATGLTWPIREGMTVAFRDRNGWIDLTPWVEWETGSSDLTVGDLPKKLGGGGDSLTQVRVDVARVAGPDNTTPAAPTGVALSTASALDSRGRTVSLLRVSWTAPTLNADGSTLADLSHYLVHYRWTVRPDWTEAPVTSGTSTEVTVAAGLPFVVRVAAVDIAGHVSAWSEEQTITTALDAIAPPAPADPIVTSYLGQLRIEYAGVSSTGQPMPTDTKEVNVHVGTTATFTPSAATRVRALTPFAKDVAFATAPYGSVRYVRLIAEDHDGNVSPSSAVISGTTTQVAPGDVASINVGQINGGMATFDLILAGSIFTAATGQRAGINSVGFQAFDASGNQTINLDGADNLLTGRYRTGLPGTRRIEMGSSGAIGKIEFFAPDGTRSEIGSFTGSNGGLEAFRAGVPIANVSQFWNNFQIQTNEIIQAWSSEVAFTVGGEDMTRGRKFAVRWTDSRETPADPFFTEIDRFIISSTANQSFYPRAGNFGVSQIETSGSTTYRLYMDPGTLTYWDAAGAERFRIASAAGTGLVYREPSTKVRLWIRDNVTTLWGNDDVVRFEANGQIVLFQPDTHKSRLVVQPGGSTLEGAKLQFLARPQANGSSFGALIKFYADTGIEIRDVNDGGWEDCYAFSFQVMSDASLKTGARRFAPGSLAKLRATPVYDYQMKQDRKGNRRHLGLVAQEAPAEIVSDNGDSPLSIDLYKQGTFIWASVQELADEVSALRAELDKMRL